MRPEPLVLEAAGDEDLDAVAAIERRSFSHPWAVRSFREAMTDPKLGRVLVLRAPGERCGPQRGIRGYCVFRTVVDEMQIHDLAVHPDHRGRGLGRRLLSLALELGARRGARVAFLEVRQSNWAALHLYRAAGFQAVSVRRNYYSHPTEDALVLQRTLPEPARPAKPANRDP